nr:hypothetical protein CVNMHQAP_CVNMHQAP_CDS_0151 [uncultured phage]
MYFKVYDGDNDITDVYPWVISSTGEIQYVDYYGPVSMKSLKAMRGLKAVLYFDDEHSKVIVNELRRCNMNFKVFDKDGKDITNNYYWVITQNGEVRYWNYGDLTGIEGVKVVIYFDNGHVETFVSSW